MWEADGLDVAEIEELDHEVLSEALLECAIEEREAIRQLELDQMLIWTERRLALTRRVLELAQISSPLPEHIRLYERVEMIARENHEILQAAQVSVRTILDDVRQPAKGGVYNARGRSSSHAGQVRNVLVWKG